MTEPTVLSREELNTWERWQAGATPAHVRTVFKREAKEASNA